MIEHQELTLNGKRVYLYKVGIGSYSNYSEEWWAHERAMTEVEMLQLLLTTCDESARAVADHGKRSNMKDIHEVVMISAGFVELLPVTVYQIETPWNESLAEYRKRLRDELNTARKEESR